MTVIIRKMTGDFSYLNTFFFSEVGTTGAYMAYGSDSRPNGIFNNTLSLPPPYVAPFSPVPPPLPPFYPSSITPPLLVCGVCPKKKPPLFNYN